MIWFIVTLAAVSLGAYLLFRDTMNKLQYIQFLRIYWITRDTGVLGTPYISKGIMLQTSEPWWVGAGVQFRAGKYTFQVGVLQRKSFDLLDQLGGRYLDESAKEIRRWK